MRSILKNTGFLAAAIGCFTLQTAEAELKLNGAFKDNMVLQRNANVSVYGKSSPNSEIKVTFAGQSKTTKADGNGKWELKLDPEKKSFDGQALTITSSKDQEDAKVENILIGDVWLCSGQSNMEYMFERFSLLKERAEKINSPNIRTFYIERKGSGRLEEKVVGREHFKDAWRPAVSPWVPHISPTAYYFAESVSENLDVPVGLLVSAVGGSQIQRWLSKESVAKLKLDSESSNGAGALYNSMIHPLKDFTIKGVIWYQGESNGKIPHSYYAMSQELITSWRTLWSKNNPQLASMPFYSVSLAPFKHNIDGLKHDAWAYIRDAQLKTLSLPNTGLAVTTDVGEYNDIHPQNKEAVGKRLALWALKDAGRTIVESGPIFKKAVMNDGSAEISFSHTGSGLETRKVVMSSKRNVWPADDPNPDVIPAETLAGFSVCGKDKKFHPATAEIKGNKVVVSSPNVTEPVAVRYGWSTYPKCNLYNKEGLPASPFRSDDFPVPDVQNRLVGKPWSMDNSELGEEAEMVMSTNEGEWASVEIDGRTGYKMVETEKKGKYAYVKINTEEFRDGKSPKAVISITYFDNHDGKFKVRYDSSDKRVMISKSRPGAWKVAGTVKLKNTKKWVVMEIPVDDAMFARRCNGKDIRIECGDKTTLGPVFIRKQQ